MAATGFASDGRLIGTVVRTGSATGLSRFVLDYASETLQLLNTAPSLRSPGDQSVSEGDLVSLPITASDPGSGQQLLFSLGSAPTGANIDPITGLFTWSPQDGLVTAQVTVRVTDNGSPALSDTKTFTITVINVAPGALIAGPTDGVRGQPRTFTFRANDVSPVDVAAGFRYVVTWGDGTADTMIDPTAGNGVGMSLDHTYVNASALTIRVTTFDKDGAASLVATHAVTITAVGVQPDPLAPGRTVLVVGGTPGPDLISVLGLGPLGMVVLVNEEPSGQYQPTSRVEVYGQAGNDVILLAGWITTPAWLLGGDGNDFLVGGDGDDVLVGGDGNDILSSRGGSDEWSGTTWPRAKATAGCSRSSCSLSAASIPLTLSLTSLSSFGGLE